MVVNERFYLALGIMALALILEHFLTWWRRLRRLEAYSIGVATMFGGIGIWKGLTPEFLQLCIFPAVAGIAVFGAWAYDQISNWRVGALTKEAREAAKKAKRASNSVQSREIRTLEDVTFTLATVLHALDIAAMRIGQRARTDAEAADLEEIARAKVGIEDARQFLLQFHPNHLEAR